MHRRQPAGIITAALALLLPLPKTLCQKQACLATSGPPGCAPVECISEGPVINWSIQTSTRPTRSCERRGRGCDDKATGSLPFQKPPSGEATAAQTSTLEGPCRFLGSALRAKRAESGARSASMSAPRRHSNIYVHANLSDCSEPQTRNIWARTGRRNRRTEEASPGRRERMEEAAPDIG
ncbi:unnamed protein product [Prorocentrum cordatum]|uniref:Secreted protein n=1 Tax=Prorocentrum cordatum TaxID=2364126 RepID=A0ABN9TD06_9DINO|nr:unnamed protein product [Polarella glacialis]